MRSVPSCSATTSASTASRAASCATRRRGRAAGGLRARLRGLREFRGDSGLATWLTRIVMNEAFGRMRRRPTEELESLDRAIEQGDTRVIMFPGVHATQSPEVAAARAEVRRILEHAIDELPETFRLVFLMRDVEELSIEETAAQLDIRPETVKTRLHRARKLLRQHLDEKLASVLKDTFPFEGARCARITDGVMARLGLADRSSRGPS